MKNPTTEALLAAMTRYAEAVRNESALEDKLLLHPGSDCRPFMAAQTETTASQDHLREAVLAWAEAGTPGGTEEGLGNLSGPVQRWNEAGTPADQANALGALEAKAQRVARVRAKVSRGTL